MVHRVGSRHHGRAPLGRALGTCAKRRLHPLLPQEEPGGGGVARTPSHVPFQNARTAP